jgi:hypothetical protein
MDKLDERIIEAYDKVVTGKVEEGKMQKGIWVTLSNKGGMLAQEFVKDNRGIKAVLMDWSSTLSDGDMIKIEKGQSEG